MNRPTKKLFALMSLMTFALIGGCSSTKVTNIWRDPNFNGPIHFKITAVIAIHPDNATRHVAEDAMVKHIGTERAVPGYAVLGNQDLKDAGQVRARLQEQGVDGAVTMKLAGARTETTYVPGNDEPSFADYYDRAEIFSADPGLVVTNTIVSVQTNIYSVTDGKLIWSGTTDLYNPTDASKIVDDIAKAVGNELRKEKLIQ